MAFRAYIKREAMWYKANNSKISKVMESDIGQELEKCSKPPANDDSLARSRLRALSAYKAKED